MKKNNRWLILLVTGLFLVAAHSQADGITGRSIPIETKKLNINLKNTTTDLKKEQSNMALASYMSQLISIQWSNTIMENLNKR